ncbi:MAG: enoyl-CoA hydratase-related protein, partial [Acidimicrobiales bacterium]|nr:enoyl-CoA hydratase-related protein [Acidimicrobiales bacterium]
MASPPDFEFLRVERTDDDVVIATLDRPKVNALDTALLLEIGDLAEACHAEPPGALVLTGGGRHFAAGADLTVFAAPPTRQAQGAAFRSGFAALA